MFIPPREANLLITHKCNLSCRHCGVYSHGKLQGELSPSEWGIILDKLADAKLLTLTLTGGEPFMREDFPEVFQEVLKRPFRVNINTNATLITDETAELLADSMPRLDTVMVSLDGDSPKTHDAIRGKGVFEKTMEGVRKLKDANISIVFYCTVNSVNIDRIEYIAELAAEYGRNIKFNTFMDTGPETDSKLSPTPDQVKQAGRSVIESALKHPGKVSGTVLEIAVQSVKANNGTAKPYSSSKVCGAVSGKIAVFPDGTVTPCDHLPDVNLGNLMDSSLEEILTGEEAEFFKRVTAMRKWPWVECHTCEYHDYCSGPCPAGVPIEGASKEKFSLFCLKNYLREQ
ncbi:MAG: radical SAM protein [Candidatus Aegiribacteria sp.]|nr:radical SAM protein [Candidatus Aegiribacteria sp.]